MSIGGKFKRYTLWVPTFFDVVSCSRQQFTFFVLTAFFQLSNRDKKKQEQSEMEDEEKELRAKNTELKEKLTDIENEFKAMKNIMVDLGLLNSGSVGLVVPFPGVRQNVANFA